MWNNIYIVFNKYGEVEPSKILTWHGVTGLDIFISGFWSCFGVLFSNSFLIPPFVKVMYTMCVVGWKYVPALLTLCRGTAKGLS